MTDSDDELLKRLELKSQRELGELEGSKWWYDKRFKNRNPARDDTLSWQAATRIRELKVERDRWESLCEKAWKDLDKMGFQGLHEAFGDGPTHVIVPVEPTEAMIDAGWVYESNSPDIYEFDVKELYRAMIWAAMQSEAGNPASEA